MEIQPENKEREREKWENGTIRNRGLETNNKRKKQIKKKNEKFSMKQRHTERRGKKTHNPNLLK